MLGVRPKREVGKPLAILKAVKISSYIESKMEDNERAGTDIADYGQWEAK